MIPAWLMRQIERWNREWEQWDRDHSCARKVSYISIIPATRQAYALSQERGYDYAPYVCRYCGDYHVGQSGFPTSQSPSC
jgi:hypothetical protein